MDIHHEPLEHHFTDDLPPFLAEIRDRESRLKEYFVPDAGAYQSIEMEGDNGQGSESHYREAEEDCNVPVSDTAAQPQESFWNRFKPSLIDVRKEKKKMKNMGRGILGHTILLCLLALFVFVVLQQFAVGGVQKMTLLATLFAFPYFVAFFVLDLKAYWKLDNERPWGFAQRFNAIIGPAIISLAISSCIFSAPLERKVWIVGDKTTGVNGTLYAVPIFSKITGIVKDQEITIDVSGKTTDGIMVNSRILMTVVCCADDTSQILTLYRGSKAKPEEVMKNYLIGVFDTAFKQAVATVKVSEMRTAYASMAKNISKKRIREETALLWNGKFSVTDSRAELTGNN